MSKGARVFQGPSRTTLALNLSFSYDIVKEDEYMVATHDPQSNMITLRGVILNMTGMYI